MPLLPAEQLTTERQRLMRELAQRGQSYAEIGETFNISRARVHQLLTGYRPPSKRKQPAT